MIFLISEMDFTRIDLIPKIERKNTQIQECRTTYLYVKKKSTSKKAEITGMVSME